MLCLHLEGITWGMSGGNVPGFLLGNIFQERFVWEVWGKLSVVRNEWGNEWVGSLVNMHTHTRREL